VRQIAHPIFVSIHICGITSAIRALMPQTNKDKTKLALSIIICLAVGGLGSFFTASSVGSWYQTLQKPPLNPPSWVFGPVWTTLYVLMGIALYLIWKQSPLDEKGRRAFAWFFIQLALNFLWSFFFFYLRQPGLAFFEIIFLWLAIAITMWNFSLKSSLAAWLLFPYIAWVSFAMYINFTIWRLNG
jgi:tryptophan-rich sensory protein